ncbi:hypothetical protein GCM10017556_18390 [Micromonospora sagamiensis]|nr:hypothetical protein GCM10017556_18390 [Micromonospora sagamiensis]
MPRPVDGTGPGIRSSGGDAVTDDDGTGAASGAAGAVPDPAVADPVTAGTVPADVVPADVVPAGWVPDRAGNTAVTTATTTAAADAARA